MSELERDDTPEGRSGAPMTGAGGAEWEQATDGECEYCGGPAYVIVGEGGLFEPEGQPPGEEHVTGCPDPYCDGFLVECGEVTAELAARHERDGTGSHPDCLTCGADFGTLPNLRKIMIDTLRAAGEPAPETVSQFPARCPSCGGLRLLSPSSFDPSRTWACCDCGHRWAERPKGGNVDQGAGSWPPEASS